jgi:hypothetical protein
MGDNSQRVKLLGRETDHSPPSIAEVKNAWSYPTTPPCIFMVWWSGPSTALLEEFKIKWKSTKY